ncbi:MAG: MFS transporter, partial [Candidatus Dormibacteria bacterium]
AVINSIGNLAGFFGPFIMGWLREATGNFAAGLLVIAAFALLAMIVVLLLRHESALERAPGGEPRIAG